MTCRDWRSADASVTASLYELEIARWTHALHWDTRETWRQVETARRVGSLPGFIVIDGSDVIGWSFQLVHRESLQVGALVASSPSVTEELVHQILASEQAHDAANILFFTLLSAPSLVTVLEQRGFATERYLHMERALLDLPSEPVVGRDWDVHDTHRTVELMSGAYEPGHAARPFARGDTGPAWLDYVRQITTTRGCGVFMPRLSVAVPIEGAAALSAVILSTVVGQGTGHLAQVAVSPGARGTGLGRRAVLAAMSKLQAAGLERVTLLVGERNQIARRLYQSLGFAESGVFVSGAIDQPRRLTSEAHAMGGASTLR